MKLTLCGSLNFSKKILEIKEMLEANGHEAILPQSIIDFCLKNNVDADKMKVKKDEYMRIKPIYTKEHFRKITESDAILVVNEEKHGVKGYIGGATFAEVMLAFHYGKKIFLLNPIPTHKSLEFIIDEVEATKPMVLNGDLDLIQ